MLDLCRVTIFIDILWTGQSGHVVSLFGQDNFFFSKNYNIPCFGNFCLMFLHLCPFSLFPPWKITPISLVSMIGPISCKLQYMFFNKFIKNRPSSKTWGLLIKNKTRKRNKINPYFWSTFQVVTVGNTFKNELTLRYRQGIFLKIKAASDIIAKGHI